MEDEWHEALVKKEALERQESLLGVLRGVVAEHAIFPAWEPLEHGIIVTGRDTDIYRWLRPREARRIAIVPRKVPWGRHPRHRRRLAANFNATRWIEPVALVIFGI